MVRFTVSVVKSSVFRTSLAPNKTIKTNNPTQNLLVVHTHTHTFRVTHGAAA